ncbi:hypothetical protein TNCV_760791 [Trichonephila clavipes]|nr:hypothetical protein TNCV_760791 [Trichonephila clavipes]
MYRNPVTSQYMLDFKKCPIEGASFQRQKSPINGHTMALYPSHGALSHTGVNHPGAKQSAMIPKPRAVS